MYLWDGQLSFTDTTGNYTTTAQPWPSLFQG